MTELGWRWTFLLPVPVAIGLLIAAPRVLAKDGPIAPGIRRNFDFAGAVTLTAGMLLLVRTIVEAPDSGWASAGTIAGLVLAAALLTTFVGIERRSASPLVRLGILRSGPLLRANLGMMAMFGAYIGFQFVGTLYLQSVLGWSPVETALAFLPGGVIVAFGAPRLGPFVDRYGTGRLILAGSASFLIGYVLFLRIGGPFTYVGVFLPTMLLVGIGFGLSFPAFNMQATAGIANHEQGLASGLVNTSLQVGGALGLALTTAVISANTGGAAQGPALVDGFQPAIAVVTTISALGLVVALAGAGLRRSRRPELALAPAAAKPAEEREAA